MTALLVGMGFGAVAASVGWFVLVVSPLADLLDRERGRTVRYRDAAGDPSSPRSPW